MLHEEQVHRTCVAIVACWAAATAMMTAITTATPAIASDPPAAAPAFEEVCFDDFDFGKGFTTAEKFKRLFQPAGGRIVETRHRSFPLVQLSGKFRLVPAWRPDSVLRLALESQKNLALHFWNGQQGVAFRFYKNKGSAWAAYGTTRRGKSPTPDGYALWAVDEGRYRRALDGTVEWRCQDGKLVFSRGDLVLIVVPFGGLPAEVYLEGEAKVFGAEMSRSQAAPLENGRRPAPAQIIPPAEINWQTDLPEDAKLLKLPDGHVELLCEKSNGNSRAGGKPISRRPAIAEAGIEIGAAGLAETIFQIDQPQPGTGIYLADSDGRHRQWIAFQSDRRTGNIVLSCCCPGSRAQPNNLRPETNVIAFAGRGQWLRVIVAAGLVKYWISGDGVHWSTPVDNPLSLSRPCSRIGIFCLAEESKRRSIRLRSIEVRRLDRLESLASDLLKQRVSFPADVKTYEAWQQWVGQSRPDDVPVQQWRRACILVALEENLPLVISQPLLAELMYEIAMGPGEAAAKFRLLDEASLLLQFPDFRQHPSAVSTICAYELVGEQLRLQGHPTPFSLTSRALLRRPGFTLQSCFPAELLWHELLISAQLKRWPHVEALCRQMNYWTSRSRDIGKSRAPQHRYTASQLRWAQHRTAVLHLLDWAEGQARLHTAEPDDTARHRPAKLWRHPLVERLGKESYNVLGEFNAALAAGAYRDACRIIATAAELQHGGLLGDPKDSQLLVSMRHIVRQAMEDQPRLRQAMQEEFALRGKLRVGQAIAENDPQALEAATVHLIGTEAAARAHRWLGDRALSAGRFDRAMHHYQEALGGLADPQQADLPARLRLAAAMLGKDVGRPITAPVTMARTVLSADEFEKLVEKSRGAHHRSATGQSPAGIRGAVEFPPCPRPRRYELRSWARLQQNKRDWPAGAPAQAAFDWRAKSIAVVAAGGRMIVNDQVEQVGFELKSGRQLWRQRSEHRGKSPIGWAPSPMQPIIDGDRILLRRFARRQTELACLNAADGKLLWSSGADADRKDSTAVISDPILLGHDLFALLACIELGGQFSLELAAFDGRTGRVTSRTLLASFRDYWSGTMTAQAAAVDEQLVVTAGGAVLCCDLLGRVVWIRRQLCVPPPAQSALAVPWLKHIHRRPIVADGRVYASQPGVWAIECIELSTGRLVWCKGLPEMTALVGRLGKTLLAETTEGLLGIDAGSGKVLWRHEIEDRLEVRLCGDEDALFYARRQPTGDRQSPYRVALVWIDPKTGRTVKETAVNVAGNSRQIPLLGPMAVAGNRQWIFSASGNRPAEREILELAAAQ